MSSNAILVLTILSICGLAAARPAQAADDGASGSCLGDVAAAAEKAVDRRLPGSHKLTYELKNPGQLTNGDFDKRAGGAWFNTYTADVMATLDDEETRFEVEVYTRAGTCEVLNDQITSTSPTVCYGECKSGPQKAALKAGQALTALIASVKDLRAQVDEYVALTKTVGGHAPVALKTWGGSSGTSINTMTVFTIQ